MNDGPLLVIDLLLLLVAQQQHHGTKQEDGSTPANAVSPTKLPQGPISCNTCIYCLSLVLEIVIQELWECLGLSVD